jgi:hypothetical protein
VGIGVRGTRRVGQEVDGSARDIGGDALTRLSDTDDDRRSAIDFRHGRTLPVEH